MKVDVQRYIPAQLLTAYHRRSLSKLAQGRAREIGAQQFQFLQAAQKQKGGPQAAPHTRMRFIQRTTACMTRSCSKYTTNPGYSQRVIGG